MEISVLAVQSQAIGKPALIIDALFGRRSQPAREGRTATT